MQHLAINLLIGSTDKLKRIFSEQVGQTPLP
jgi:hypothetical protein